MIKAIIVDDELLLVNELNKLLSQFVDVEVVGVYTNPKKAYKEIETSRPDIAFLDIEMAEMNGIVLAEKLLRKMPELDILFVTAYNHYATEAFDTNAIDYILKPVRLERLQKALEKTKKKKNTIQKDIEKTLRIQSFGKFGVFLGDEPLRWARAKQQELFAYLSQNEGQWVDKYKICDDLWRDSEPDQALANLQTAVWAVRKVLKDSGINNIKIDYSRDSYILQIKDVVWDLRQFNDAYKQFTDTGNSEVCKEAIRIYRDGYLFNEDWLWAIIEHGKYAKMYSKFIRKR